MENSGKSFTKNMNKKTDIICLGEVLIDFLPVQSGVALSEVTEFKRVPGGAPANVAVGAAKLGLSSAFMGRVGDDIFGKFLVKTLEDNQVNISQVQYDKKARTCLAFISLPTPNSREFLFYRNPSADMNLDYRKFNKNLLQNVKIFHYGSITLITEPSRSSTYKAIDIAKSAGSVISYDPNLRNMLWPSLDMAKKTMKHAISFADVVKLNDEELQFITGETELEKGLKKIKSMGPRICIVTLGEKGSYYATEEFLGKVDAYKVDTVDATGCGDSFVSGILFGVIKKHISALCKDEKALLEVIRFSSAAAAITSTQKGVIPALPTKNEVDDFILKRKN